MDSQHRPGRQRPTAAVPPPGWASPPPSAPLPRPLSPPRRRRTGLLVGVVVGAVLQIAATALVPVLLFSHPAAAAPVAPGAHHAAAAPTTAPNGILLDIGPGPASSPPRDWGGTPFYDACSLISQRTVEDQGIALDPQYTVTADNPQIGNSGSGAGVTQPNTTTMGSSSCFYPGVGLADTVALTVFQAPFVTPDTIQTELETDQTGASSSAAVQGYDVYSRQDGKQTLLTIANPGTPNVLAELDINLTHTTFHGHTAQDVVTALTNTVITGLRQPPGPASQIRYAAPYSGFDPCTIFGATDFATYLGQPDDQHPHAEYQLGERELDTNPGSPHDVVAHYIDTTCQRFSVPLDQGQSTAPGIVARFEVYQSVAQAQAAMTVTCTPDADPGQDKIDHPFGPPITTLDGKPITIGHDTPACYPRIKAGDWNLTFRAGRTIAYLWLWQEIDESKLDQLTPIVAPLAQDLAAKLGAWCRC